MLAWPASSRGRPDKGAAHLYRYSTRVLTACAPPGSLATVLPVPSPALPHPSHAQPFDPRSDLRSLKIKINLVLDLSPFVILFDVQSSLCSSSRPSTIQDAPPPRDQASLPRKSSNFPSICFYASSLSFLLPYVQRYLSLLILRTLANFRRYRSPPALKWRHMSRINCHRPFSWCI